MTQHPKLAKKLKLLYELRLNPEIKSNADLGRLFNISRQAISRWCNGSETDLGDKIPDHQVIPLCKAFGIKHQWLSRDLEEFESLVRERALNPRNNDPSRPERISVSSMPITNEEIFGRESETKLLDDIWRSSETNVVQIVGFGGTGKSSLVNSWLSKMDERDYAGAEKVYAWSFYWQGCSRDLKTSGDMFVEHALEWFGDENPTIGTPWAKASRLATLIRDSNTLLILDGLEPLQNPPGPKEGQIDSPAVALLLRELAADNRGLCIITTRLPVSDVSAFSDGRSNIINLENLTNDMGVEMLQRMGVSGGQSQIGQIVSKYEGHPLSLKLFGSYLCIAFNGDVRESDEVSSLMNESEQSIYVTQLMKLYLDWFSNRPELYLLSLVGLIGRAVEFNELVLIIQTEEIPGLTKELLKKTPQNLRFALNRLESAALISISTIDGNALIDCHPIVRDYICDNLEKEYEDIWKAGNELLFNHLRTTAKLEPKNMLEFEPLFRSVIHGAQAGLYNDAFDLYFVRIKNGQFSMFTEGSHHADQACIRSFFEEEWTKPISELSIDAKFYLLSCAATNLIYLGYINEAIEPSLTSIDWFSKNDKWLEALNATGPLASMLIAAGRIEEALSLLDEMEDCIEKTNNLVVQAMAKNFVAYILHLFGNDAAATSLFEKTEKVLNMVDPGVPVMIPTISAYYCKYLLDIGSLDEALERSLKTFSWREQKTWQVEFDTTSLLASDTLVLGLIYLKMNNFENAEIHLNKQVEMFKSNDEWLYLPTGLNSRALLYIETEKYEEAEIDLLEALDISERTGAKFGEWETCINLCRLYLVKGNLNKGGDYLKRATGMAGMSAYKFRDSEIAELEVSLTEASKLTGKSTEKLVQKA